VATDEPHYDVREVYEGTTGRLLVTTMHAVPNCARRAKGGDYLSVHYIAKIAGDPPRTFENTHESREPLDLRLNAGMVIQGLDRGLHGMCVGDLRTITIPPNLAYGKRGAPPTIPPEATLVFEVELISIGDTNPAAQNFLTQMKTEV
jgi:FK506-binding protein 2